MTTAVEAKSLSSLTTLAFNPPSYPRNPTHVKHEPLVLYIAKVPGSRDVFLTPMKPRQKVVTAEDVQSSLYYLHFDSPEDELLKQEIEEERGTSPAQEHETRDSQTPMIPRKPVKPPRQPLPPNSSQDELTARPPPLVVRKPVGPPSVLAPRNDIENRHNMAAPGPRQEAATPPHAARQRPHRSTGARSPQPPTNFPEQPSIKTPEQPISLTLIRRDPASGAQWNIGKISDPPVYDVSSEIPAANSAQQRHRKPGTPFYIEIDNAGYNKFANTESRPHLPRGNSHMSVMTASSATDSQYSKWQPKDSVFRRRMWLEGSRYAPETMGHRKMGSEDSGYNSLSVSRQSMDMLSSGPRSPGYPSNVDPHLAADNRRSIAIPPQDKKPGFRGYVFTSPWNGRCEFTTGSSGTSLKCKHILPINNAAMQAYQAVTVSELRFNLPIPASSNRRPAAPSTSTEDTNASKRSSMFVRPPSQRPVSMIARSASLSKSAREMVSSLSQLDLSLGQEFAGGGFGGKHAKLGKLIIQDEGLKMLDLVVATNIGLWWRAYERTERSES
ncbi:hypothetical protein K490DRAFT_39457 [Saccharata proteae CBS 121410]|uniref:Uncharacterized protein n=1 Tax=Saccharata proteae CBS 121410 TaxID=1314787 RepID=A0A9P4LZZ0_9PEZI|nr:hypothetical protein K490DRAFT_39457 [Saccharata proteae CBS 121410]